MNALVSVCGTGARNHDTGSFRRIRREIGPNPGRSGSIPSTIDGLVDAGVLVDDDDERVRSVTFLPIDSSAEFAGLRLIIEETTWTS